MYEVAYLISSQNRKQEEEVVDFFAHRHVVGVVTASAVRLFDLVRGFFVEEVPLPKPIVLDGGVRRRFFPSSAGVASSGLWRIGGLGLSAANIGVWSADGLWTLQYPRVTKQAEFLIKVSYCVMDRVLADAEIALPVIDRCTNLDCKANRLTTPECRTTVQGLGYG